MEEDEGEGALSSDAEEEEELDSGIQMSVSGRAIFAPVHFRQQSCKRTPE